MKKSQLILSVVLALIIIACHTSKKSTTSLAASSPTSVTSTTTVPAEPLSAPSAKPTNGIYEPGNDELSAIQKQYGEVTLDKLKRGYSIYSEGACIKCHNAQNIYRFDEFQWGSIIDNMALKASLTPAEKDAVYKYVLAIKAAKPK